MSKTPGEHVYWPKLVAVYLAMCAAMLLFMLHLAHDDWVRVGVLHEAAMKYEGTVASPNVSFYATSPGSVEEIRQELLRFRQTVPDGVSVHIE